MERGKNAARLLETLNYHDEFAHWTVFTLFIWPMQSNKHCVVFHSFWITKSTLYDHLVFSIFYQATKINDTFA